MNSVRLSRGFFEKGEKQMENNSNRRSAPDRYHNALAAFRRGATWDGLKDLTFWAVAAGLSADDVITDARAQGVTDRDADIRRGMETARPKVDAWNAAHADGRTARSAYRPKPKPPKPKPSRAVEDCVEAGRRGLCTSSAAVMALSPVDVRHMDAGAQRRAQLAAMFDRPDLQALPVGIAPHSGAWIPRAGHDFMPVADWLSDGARLATAGELVKINPFTGASEDRTDGKQHLATNATVATFPNALMEFDKMPLSDQCAFWYGALTLYRLPVAALVYSGGKSIHGVVRVDCATRAEFDKAADLARRTFATSPNPSMRLDVQSLALPIAGARLAGCVRADTRRAQRLLYVAQAATPPPPPPPPPRAQETPTARPVPQTGNPATEAEERDTGEEIGVSAHVSTDRLLARDSDMFMPRPQEPDGNAPFEELQDYFIAIESIA